ncbi:putative malate dehydrogenase [Rhypophila decipiens]|uniref:Malate dehydrogenase n=1 Tax=Rhypophila decipiens TaxID=261697 RepID=A0AAN6YBD2_9PEZI|nr:putative malate dehydrogenase [Rhypophila decipiens]
MYASLLLVSALGACSALAAPVTPDLKLAPSIDTVSEYFNMLAATIKGVKPGPVPVCDISKAKLPAGASGLAPPSAGFKIKHIALGRGTQNYTCDLSKPDEAPKAAGAVATLFDASCVVSAYPDLARSLGKVAMQFNLTSAESKLNPSNLAISGHHFFTGPTTPFFDLDVSTKKLGHANCAKDGATPAPANAPKGQKGEAAVPWLKLLTISGATGNLREVYRVETVGGSAPATCQGLPAGFTVQYAAQYWFYEGKA